MKKILDEILIALFMITLVSIMGCEENNYGIEEPVDRIELQEVPLSDYVIGDKLDISDMVVAIIRESGKKEEILYDDFERMGVLTEPRHGDRLDLSNDVVKVMYAVSGNSLTYPLTVNMPDWESEPIKKIKIVQQPERNYYKEGTVVDLAGMVLIVSYERLGDIEVTPDLFDDFSLTSTPAIGEEYTASIGEIFISSNNYDKDVYVDMIIDPVFVYFSDFSSGTDGWSEPWDSGINLSAEDGNMIISVNEFKESWQNASFKVIEGPVPGKTYQLSVRAKSLEADRKATLIFQMNGSPWTTYTPQDEIAMDMSSEFKMFTTTFVMGDPGDTELKMQFNTDPGENNDDLNNYTVSEIALIELEDE